MGIEKKKQSDRGEDAGAGSAGEETGKPIVVHSYAGFKSDERPRSFELEGRKLTILAVKKTWQEESAAGRRRKTFFRVHAHDGRTYEIALDQGSGQWSLEPHRGREPGGPES